MPNEKQRTMFYRRVAWREQPGTALEECLEQAHAQLATTAARTFAHGDGELQGLAWHARPAGLCLHVASYVPDQSTSLVPIPSSATSGNTSQEPPPAGENFLEGDIFLLVKGDDIVLCPSGARESVAISYINQVLRAAGEDDLVTRFTVEAVANIDQIKVLQKEGVKKISLNSSLYEATMEYTERTTTKRTLLNGMAADVLALFAEDKNLELREVSAAENLTVKLEISFDSRRKGGKRGQERLEAVAARMLADGEHDGFSILTGGDKMLTANEVRINKKVSLPAYGNSVSRTGAWTALAEYLDELKDSGTLQQ